MATDFQGLAPELLNNVLGRLLGPNRPDPIPREFLKTGINSYAWRIRNQPTYETAILATNKYLHAVSKSI
jgi:hypothetical protein